MHKTEDNIISAEEKDILQEVMNISFGQASADLAEVINARVILSVPQVALLRAHELPEFIGKEIEGCNGINLVEQNFLGRLKGMTYLIFPSEAGRELISMLEDEYESISEKDNVSALERDTLLEVGNILIGACVGKIAELLKEIVTYSPPRVVLEHRAVSTIPKALFKSDDFAIVMRTVFRFDREDVSGYLFLIMSQESFDWLKVALREFVEQYE